jgi:dihydrodipicolinate synthase/N-acetylneuraminate lyase
MNVEQLYKGFVRARKEGRTRRAARIFDKLMALLDAQAQAPAKKAAKLARRAERPIYVPRDEVAIYGAEVAAHRLLSKLTLNHVFGKMGAPS